MRLTAMRHVLLCLTAPTQSTTESCRVCKSRSGGGTKTEQKPNNRQCEPWRWVTSGQSLPSATAWWSNRAAGHRNHKSTVQNRHVNIWEPDDVGARVLSTSCTFDTECTCRKWNKTLFIGTQWFHFLQKVMVVRASTSPSRFPFRGILPMLSKHCVIYKASKTPINLCASSITKKGASHKFRMYNLHTGLLYVMTCPKRSNVIDLNPVLWLLAVWKATWNPRHYLLVRQTRSSTLCHLQTLAHNEIKTNMTWTVKRFLDPCNFIWRTTILN